MDSNCSCKNEFKLGVSEHFSKSILIHTPNQPQASSKPYAVYENILNEFSAIDTNNELIFPNENQVIIKLCTKNELMKRMQIGNWAWNFEIFHVVRPR